MRPVSAIIAVIFVLFSGLSVSATVFDVDNIEVDETADTASKARELALANGYRDAYTKLLERLVPRESLNAIQPVSDKDLQGLVERFQVYEEKNSATRYLATLKVVFQPERVRDHLRGQYIRFSEVAAKPILVLPVYSSAGSKHLWDGPNPWREAWGIAALTEGLVPFVLPSGDVTDYSLISADHAAAANDYRLAAIAERYQVDQVLIAEAEENIDFRTGGNKLEARGHYVSLQNGERQTFEFSAAQGSGMEDPFLMLASRLTQTLEEDWKKRTLLDFSKRQRLNARVTLGNLKTWLVMRNILDDVSVIESIQLTSMSIDAAQVDIRFLGSTEKLKTALTQKNLSLEAIDGYWMLKPAGS